MKFSIFFVLLVGFVLADVDEDTFEFFGADQKKAEDLIEHEDT